MLKPTAMSILLFIVDLYNQSMYEIILKFGFSLAVLLFSTHKLVGLAKKISSVFRISPLIVGMTVVAIGTSLPELAVSLVAILRHDTGLAIGNIIGSNIINILLVFPVGLLIGKLRIGRFKTQRNAIILIIATGAFYISQTVGVVKSLSGPLLLSLAVLTSIAEYKFAIFGRDHEDAKQFKQKVNGTLGIGTLLFGLLLTVGIVIGSIFIVDAIEEISLITGISTTILGLTLTAFATSLPELLTTIFSQGEKQEKITLGNILGSNIYNLLLVGGIILLFSPGFMIPQYEWLWLGGTTAGLVGVIRYYKGQKPPRSVGIVFFVLLCVYLLSL